MAKIDIDFDWHRAFKYEFATSKKGPVIRQKGAGAERCWPIRTDESLYLKFAHLDGSPEACLDFARRWGFLETLPGKEAEEEVDLWKHHIKFVRMWITALEGDLDGAQQLARGGIRSRTKITSVDVLLSTDSAPAGAHRGLVLRPRSLIDAIMLQLAQSVASGNAISTCQQCSKWFEVGGKGKRNIAKFCSDRCRSRFNYEQRVQK